MVSSTPRPHFTPEKDQVPILQEAGCAPGPVWTGGKSRSRRDSIPDRPARSQSLYRLSYRAHKKILFPLKFEPTESLPSPASPPPPKISNNTSFEKGSRLCPTFCNSCKTGVYIKLLGASAEWNWQGQTEVFGEEPVPEPLCSPQISLAPAEEWTRAFAVRGRRLTAWLMKRGTALKNIPNFSWSCTVNVLVFNTKRTWLMVCRWIIGICCTRHTIHTKHFAWSKLRVFKCVHKIATVDCYFRHVCPSAWTRNFMKFDIWVFFEKSVEKIQVSLKSDNNNRYCTWRPIYIFDHISLSSS